MDCLIEIKDAWPRFEKHRMAEKVNLNIASGEQVAIVGRNGSGKSRLVDIITGRKALVSGSRVYDFNDGGRTARSNLASDNIRYITFRDSYGSADAGFFYQQRWNSIGMDESPSVRSFLPPEKDGYVAELFSIFDMAEMIDKPVIQLSSGELRKLQIIRTLADNPRVLVLDNPFLGLDVGTRGLLATLLGKLVSDTGLQIVLVLTKPEEIPDFVDSVIPVENLVCGEKMPVKDYLQSLTAVPEHPLDGASAEFIRNLPVKEPDCGCIVKLDDVTVRYGDRTILKNLDWTVNKGEKWVLRGDNGSGKSTLLSIVCADNPQSYACAVSLFGRRRGTGESIWDIKKNIGYVSPEMHRSYQKACPALEIVASGLHDNIGLYRKVSDDGLESCRRWMDVFGISSLAERNFMELSSGEQRLVLLARAFVKDPELLVLDEPFHGLDPYNFRLAKDVVEAYCARRGKTMIMVTHYDEELPACITDTLVLQRI